MDVYRSKIGFAELVFFTAALWTLFFVVTVQVKANQQADSLQKKEAAVVVKSDHAQVEKPKPLAIVPEVSGLVSSEPCSSCEADGKKAIGTQPHLDLRQSIIADIPLLFTKEQFIAAPANENKSDNEEADKRENIDEDLAHTFVATAYCIKNYTACGVMTRAGIVAADPAVLPLGSIVRIEAGKYSGLYRVLDTGPGVRGKRLDIFVSCRREAINFGRRKIKLAIVRRGWGGQQAANLGE